MNTVVVFLYTLFVAVVSLSPGTGSSIDPWDKLAHFGTYGIFTVLVWGITGYGRRFIVACLCIVLYGGIIEITQSFLPGRVMSGYDFLANTLGVVIAGSWLWRRVAIRRAGVIRAEHRN
ncbi:VanZ family protein [Candidatus Marimicrobium litorale]|uniref:VanZ family protein n=1 Tax=Candidatus Marimicrobium litorale TaxID=2518991 RepID=UPI00242A8859|nr:VanZ family protein [Candidatus Marimicrobium litorale]